MKTVLVISSFVAASRVGASASSFCLRRLGVETVTMPTTLLGRHPGWGTPGGGPVDAFKLDDVWRQGIAPQNIAFDAVLTGYMASHAQVVLAAEIIDTVKKTNPDAFIMVDPVMGDHGSLYIDPDIAEAIKTELIPRASLITPNLWELGYLTERPTESLEQVLAAANSLHRATLVTSVPDGANIGAAYIADKTAAMVSHKRFDTIPHGGGDALAAIFLGHILKGQEADMALGKSVASIFKIISAAISDDSGELPLVRQQDAIIDVLPLTVKRHVL